MCDPNFGSWTLSFRMHDLNNLNFGFYAQIIFFGLEVINLTELKQRPTECEPKKRGLKLYSSKRLNVKDNFFQWLFSCSKYWPRLWIFDGRKLTTIWIQNYFHGEIPKFHEEKKGQNILLLVMSILFPLWVNIWNSSWQQVYFLAFYPEQAPFFTTVLYCWSKKIVLV